jgi:hypothetical protein
MPGVGGEKGGGGGETGKTIVVIVFLSAFVSITQGGWTVRKLTIVIIAITGIKTRTQCPVITK